MLATLLTAPLPVRLGLLYSLGVLAISWLMLLFSVRPSSLVVPLHYSYRFGVDLIGAWYLIFTIPLIGTVLFGVSAWLMTHKAVHRQPVSYFLTVSLALSQTLLAIESYYLAGLAKP
jgi:hypothetical protein